MDYTKEFKDVVDLFKLEGKLLEVCPYGEGHINQTLLVTTTKKRYILQKMNTHVFKDPDALMKNICYVTEALQGQGIETLCVIPTKKEEAFLKLNQKGKLECFRMYDFIENAVTFQKASNKQVFYNSGKAFGEFQNHLANFDASLLTETIPNFHNTVKRFEDFLKAVKEDKVKRVKDCRNEIDFILKRQNTLSKVLDGLKDGSIPLRVTHNDTKLNNILMDDKSFEARAIIDLDTIMPGSLLYDFGDSIRFGASTAAEDEKDLNKVHFDLELFKTYALGYYSAVSNSITAKELELLPYSAYLLTMECGMRFLADYLSGDIYFQIHYKDHNLVRARTQLKLVSEIENRFSEMEACIKEITK
ncbi:MAG: aminoglycoside phosphotransferase family protein [Roseburia sp.]|nr:aminoglycoside phosphotransferase family protein [Anaeroplasma bactoclasticum]MCM1195599.1 aminoglycoside phosphotransferase family protein [Roseburia sp.]MCM1556189.1 aminoglycoside phosphotransferase family protein [Anaeroplasma bactoclasticum]